MKLYSYFRSSASFRLRIALALKKLDYEFESVHLRRGEHRTPRFLALNPQGFVPVLVDGDATLTQSMAIIEYLDERYPEPPLLPAGAAARARVRAMAQVVACDIHPINNLRVLRRLERELGQDEAARAVWARRWIGDGFEALEKMLAGRPETGRFCHGDAPTLADVCLVPQVFGARRFETDLAPYPEVVRIHGECMALPAFADQAPGKQPDAE